jgi:hypothetical protein
MIRGTIECELVGRKDQKTYRVVLDIHIRPQHVNEEAATVGDTLENEQLAPGQKIPDGEYTRRPYQFARQSSKVHVERGKMYAGWLSP